MPTPAAPLAREAFDAPAGAGGGRSPSPAPPTVLDRQIAMLERMSELCMQVAEANGRRALAQVSAVEAAEAAVAAGLVDETPSPAVPPAIANDATIAFTKAARALRMTVGLWRQLVREQDAGHAAAAHQALEARRERAAERRLRAERVVERIAHDHFEVALPGAAYDGRAIAAARNVTREARERLEDDGLYGDLADRPFSEIVAKLCRDIGVTPVWAELAGEPWAQAEIGGGPEGLDPVGLPLMAWAPMPGMRKPGATGPNLPHGSARPADNVRGADRAVSVRWRRRHEPPDDGPPPTNLTVTFV